MQRIPRVHPHKKATQEAWQPAGSRRVTRAPNYIKNSPRMHKEGVIMLICTLAGAFFHAWKYASCWCVFFHYVNNLWVRAVWLADLMCWNERASCVFVVLWHDARMSFSAGKKSRQKYASSGACSLALYLSVVQRLEFNCEPLYHNSGECERHVML